MASVETVQDLLQRYREVIAPEQRPYRKLAARFGVSVPTFFKWATGAGVPDVGRSAQMAAIISEALPDVTESEVMSAIARSGVHARHAAGASHQPLTVDERARLEELEAIVKSMQADLGRLGQAASAPQGKGQRGKRRAFPAG